MLGSNNGASGDVGWNNLFGTNENIEEQPNSLQQEQSEPKLVKKRIPTK